MMHVNIKTAKLLKQIGFRDYVSDFYEYSHYPQGNTYELVRCAWSNYNEIQERAWMYAQLRQNNWHMPSMDYDFNQDIRKILYVYQWGEPEDGVYDEKRLSTIWELEYYDQLSSSEMDDAIKRIDYQGGDWYPQTYENVVSAPLYQQVAIWVSNVYRIEMFVHKEGDKFVSRIGVYNGDMIDIDVCGENHIYNTFDDAFYHTIEYISNNYTQNDNM